MNTHDIELPEGITNHKIAGHDGPVYTDVQVRELIKADRKRRGEPVGWQPIETAPHGEEVLLGWLEWDGAWKMEVSPASWGWSTKTASNISRHGQVTHWMPLPDAPQPAEPVNMDLVRKWQAENGVEQDPDSREARMVVIRHDDDGKPTVWCDPEIADLVRALNDGGLATVGSCSGHGWRPGNIMLADGRVLVVCKDADEAREVESHFPGINGEAPLAAEPVKVPSEEERAAQGLPPYNPRHPTEEEWNRIVENGRKAWGYKPTKWDYRFLDMARLVASWSKDPSTKVGAVIVDDKNRIVSLGYNGPPRGVEDDESVDRNKKLKRTLHAETNAVLFARDSLAGTSLYVTHHPCGPCAALIAQAGIARVVIPDAGPKLSQAWSDDIKESKWIFEQAGITLERIEY